MNQREGVFAAVSEVVGEVTGKVELTDPQKDQVYAILTRMFQANEIEYKGGCPDSTKLKKYIPGLVNNWLRKDPALNGNTKYVAKKPGSRAGSGDEQLKAMRGLLAMTTDPEARKQIEAEITARVAELKPKVIVNIEALPPALRKFVTQQ
jgi:hypothetical protein